MNRTKSLDEWLAIMGVKLLPYQKELLEMIIERKEPCVFHPSDIRGRIYMRTLTCLMCELLKGENNDHY